MGARIEGVAACRPGRWPRRARSIRLATRAARDALVAAGRAPDDVGLLIHAGIYRDGNVCEPAIAPFVQRGIAANLAPPLAGAGTFAFDVGNGASGLLTAIQLVDGFLASGSIGCGLVVASDVDPAPRVSQGCRFDPAGAAIVLGPGAPGRGFTAFHFETFPEFAGLYAGELRFLGGRRRLALGGPGHGLAFHQGEKYLARCVDCTEVALGRFAAVDLESVDLIVPSHSPAGFPAELARRLALADDRVVDVSGSAGSPHTAGVAVALAAAVRDGRFASARRVLFVTASAGITVALALYATEASSASGPALAP
jgi:3-oxoacyl-[acyl-carrier-protein] synthase-3